MLLFFALAACMPAHAAALNDRSLMPPMSVTMQACAALPPALAPPLAPLLLAGGLPQAAAASTRPPTARTPTSRMPRTGRKTISLRCRTTSLRWSQLPGAYARPVTATPFGLTTALGRYASVTKSCPVSEGGSPENGHARGDQDKADDRQEVTTVHLFPLPREEGHREQAQREYQLHSELGAVELLPGRQAPRGGEDQAGHHLDRRAAQHRQVDPQLPREVLGHRAAQQQRKADQVQVEHDVAQRFHVIRLAWRGSGRRGEGIYSGQSPVVA